MDLLLLDDVVHVNDVVVLDASNASRDAADSQHLLAILLGRLEGCRAEEFQRHGHAETVCSTPNAQVDGPLSSKAELSQKRPLGRPEDLASPDDGLKPVDQLLPIRFGDLR